MARLVLAHYRDDPAGELVTDLPTPAPSVPNTPAGWYPDHTGAPQLRWWDGAAWTERVSPVTPASGVAPYSLRPAPRTVPANTPVYNVFIWVIALLPLLGIVTLLTINLSALVATSSDPLAMYRDPGYITSLVLGWVVYGGAVVLAYFDRKRLLRDGYDRPFHWAWTFFSGGVYVIGRSVIVGRRAGHGRAPLWVWVAITVFVVVINVVKFSMFVATLVGTAPLSS
ncbi:hypothetical protein BH09ACT2_BH09ACT2_09180 [soil metagenome]